MATPVLLLLQAVSSGSLSRTKAGKLLQAPYSRDDFSRHMPHASGNDAAERQVAAGNECKDVHRPVQQRELPGITWPLHCAYQGARPFTYPE